MSRLTLCAVMIVTMGCGPFAARPNASASVFGGEIADSRFAASLLEQVQASMRAGGSSTNCQPATQSAIPRGAVADRFLQLSMSSILIAEVLEGGKRTAMYLKDVATGINFNLYLTIANDECELFELYQVLE